MSEPETADDFFALAEERYEDENLEDAIKKNIEAIIDKITISLILFDSKAGAIKQRI